MSTIATLTRQELLLLRRMIRSNSSKMLKQRCQCILYSYYGLPPEELMELCNVTYQTVITWLDRWQKNGMEGLSDKPRQGRNPYLRVNYPPHQEVVKQALTNFPDDKQKALQYINQQLSVSISQITLRRFLKKMESISISYNLYRSQNNSENYISAKW